MRSSKIVRILISAPSDVQNELHIILEVIKNWNATYSEKYGVFIECVHWITHSTSQMGERPQDVLNKQIVNDSDILIAIFWSRLGTSTGKEKSGTVEEIKKFINDGKPVLLYFSNRPIPRDVDPDQLRELNEFQDECKTKQLGLYFEFETLENFERKIIHDISSQISKIEIVEDNKGVSEKVKKISKKDIFDSNLRQFDIFVKRIDLDWKIPEQDIIISGHSPDHPYSTYLKRFEDALWDFYKIYNYEISEDIGQKIFAAIKLINEISNPKISGALSGGLYFLSKDYMIKHKERVMQTLKSILEDLKELNIY